MSNQPKFEEVYSKHLKVNILLDDLIERYDNDLENYKQDFENNILCPECKKAVLSLKRRAKTPHLFTKRDSQEKVNSHADDCSEKVDYASKKQVLDYVTNISNKHQINRRLNSLLDKLFKKPQDSIEKSGMIDKKDFSYPQVIDVQVGNENKKKALRRKRIDSLIDKIKPDEEYIMYYGEVTIEITGTQISEKTQQHFKTLYFRKANKKTKKLLCSLTIWGEWKLNKVNPIIEKIQSQKTYKVAFLGKITKNENFNNCFLDKPEFLVIRN